MSYAFPAIYAEAPYAAPRRDLRPKPVGGWAALRRVLAISAGLFLMALGSVAAIAPLHLGLPVVLAGLALVLRHSWRAKRVFLTWQKRRPNWLFPVRRLLRPKPEIAPVLWHSLLRTERLLFTPARAWRVLKRIRRALRREFGAALSVSA